MLLDENRNAHDDPAALTETEAELVLRAHAASRVGDALAEVLARQAIRVGQHGDFAVQYAALRAMLERLPDAMRVRRLDGPRGGRFVVAEGKERGAHREEVWLEGVWPLAPSCGCTDFVRSGLGVCAHVLAVLERLEPKRGPWPAFGVGEALRWDPIHPLRGPADPWRRLGVGEAGAVRPTQLAGAEPRALLAGLKRLERRSRRVSPAAAAVLGRELQRAGALASANAQAPAAVSALRSLKRSLYPYQREAVLRFLSSGALLIADDMGLGKTTQAIAACHALVRSGAVERVLLVVPASLKPQWRREWMATTDVPIELVEGRADERAVLYDDGPGVLCVGYEQLRMDLTRIQAWGPELVVLDEAQRIKNCVTQTARAVAALCCHEGCARYRLALTGTPMQNRLSELASVLSFVDGTVLGPPWQMVARHTFQVGDAGSGQSGARHLDELRERLGTVMVRRLRKEVIAQLPARTDTRIPVPLTPAQAAAHDDYEEPIRRLMSIRNHRPLTNAERERLMLMLGQQRRISNGLAQRDFERVWPELKEEPPTPALLGTLDAPKLAALRELVQALVIEQGRKVVVFSEWRAMLRLSAWAVRDLLEAAGLRAAFFTGKETPRMREQALVDFHDDPALRILFLTDAGGVGLNLQRAASACIQLELPWNPAVMEQRIGRIHRLGQRQPIEVFHLVSEGGIEAKIAGLLGRKRALSAALLDANEVEVRFDTGAGIFDLATSLEVSPTEEELMERECATDPIADATPSGPTAPSGPEAPSGPAPAADPAAAEPTRADDVGAAAAALSPAPLGLRMTSREDGGASFDVPAELVGPMVAMLRTMASLLEASPKLASLP
jgi:superfamily II DNA or RNA helicase